MEDVDEISPVLKHLNKQIRHSISVALNCIIWKLGFEDVVSLLIELFVTYMCSIVHGS